MGRQDNVRKADKLINFKFYNMTCQEQVDYTIRGLMEQSLLVVCPDLENSLLQCACCKHSCSFFLWWYWDRYSLLQDSNIFVFKSLKYLDVYLYVT